MPFPLDESQLRQSETELGASFPSDYVEAMLAENGGEVEVDDEVWFLHPIKDTSERKRLARTASHVVHETNEWRQWGDTPEGAVAIASDGFGNCLYFARSGSSFGPEVFMWDHETRETAVVAATFADLART